MASIESIVESNGGLTETKIQELLSLIAWLSCQLFGWRSEKLGSSVFQPVLPRSILFLQPDRMKTSGKRTTAQAPSKAKPDGKKKESRRNRELLEGLPVVEVVIEPDRVDLDRYRQIGEERTLRSNLNRAGCM